MNLIKAELRKLLYSKSTYGLVAAAVLVAIIGTVTVPFVVSNDQLGVFGSLQDPKMVDAVFAKAVSGYIFAIILGILIMAGEFRHGTAVATFLAAPKRAHVLIAKLVVAALMGVVLQLFAALASIGAGLFALSFFEDAASPSDTVFLNVTLAAMLSGAVLALVGVAIGSLIRNQLIAIVSTLVWLFVLEPVMLLLFVDAGKWFPTGAITGMLALDLGNSGIPLDTDAYLSPGTSALLLLGYGAVFAVTALVTSLRRDID